MFGEIKDKIILKYDSQVPRYTSYPTAPQFNDEINSNIYVNWLNNLENEEDLSLYIHIPFCNEICWYCGCYTKSSRRYTPIEDYVHMLAREIRIIGEILRNKAHKVSNIHFGGGSPTILASSCFEFLMQIIKSEFDVKSDAEIAIEVDPRNVDEEKVKTYAKMGVNRVSIGVQDFNRQVQVAINRVQSFDQVYETVRLFRYYGVRSVNLDLIYGLPKQTIQMVRKNIDYAMLLKPDRIALFSYAHVSWKKKHMRMINESDLPDSRSKITMYKQASEMLNQEGYDSIGLDHFVKKSDSMCEAFGGEKLKRNFQGYSCDKSSNLIGLGVSSISYLPFGYAQNTLNFAEYKEAVLDGKLPIVKGVEIKKEDAVRKKIIDEIMCYMEVDLGKICGFFNLPIDYFDKEVSQLDDLKNDGLVRVKNNIVRINLAAPQIARIVCSIFDEFFESDTKKHSSIS